MSFLDDWGMMIKESGCDVCDDILCSSDEYQKKFQDIREKYKDDKDGYWKENWRLNKERHDKIRSICFVFRTDYGGDGFSLCKEHLNQVIKKIEEVENNEDKN